MKYKIGDIMYNPCFGDLWIVSSRYNEEIDKEELYIKKVDYDYDEDIDIADGFKKVGNIYSLIFETNDEDDKDE